MSDRFTAAVASGKIRGLAEFAAHCARVMGECAQSLSEDSGGTPTDYPYETSEVVAAEAQLEAFLDMSPVDALALFMVERDAEVREATWRIAAARQSRRRYEAMLAQAERQKSTLYEWPACCQFLVELLDAAIERDCDTRYWDRKLEPVTYDAWRKARVRKFRREISKRKSFVA
jgi:hypothetical protein